MSQSSEEPKHDRAYRRDPGRQFLVDLVSAARRPDGCVITLILLDRARELCEQFRDEGEPMTLSPLIIRACALALRKHPWMAYMSRGRKVVEPAGIDIGVAVSSPETVTPVVVIPDADTKSPSAIAQELRTGGREIKRLQQVTLARMRKIGRLIPLPFVRTWIAKLFIRSQRARRRVHGTFQVTSLAGEGVEMGMPLLASTTGILSYGSVVRRAVVVDGQVQPRLCAYFSLVADHRFANGKLMWEFLLEVKSLLENPEALK